VLSPIPTSTHVSLQTSRPERRAAIVADMQRLSGGLALVLLCVFGWVSVPSRAAQEPTGTAESEAELLRTRGLSGWRSYVWTLQRPRLQRALGDLEEARRLGGGDSDFTQTYLIAYGNLVLGRAERGERAAQEARRRAPTYSGLLLLDAFAATLAGDSDAAMQQLDQFVEATEGAKSEPEFRFLARLHRGVQLFDIGENDRAIEDLEIALVVAREAQRKPPNEAVLRLALAHQRVQQFAAAEKLVREMLADDPANPYLYYNLGLLFGTQNDFAEARRWYLQAAQRKRDYPDPRVKLAFLAWKESAAQPEQLRTMREHLEAYRNLIGPQASDDLMADAESGFGSYWFAVGEQRTVAGHGELASVAYQRALAHFRRALEHRPECVRALSMLVKIGFLIGSPDSEIEPFKQRLDEIQQEERRGPDEYRSTFC